jgi:hypothetical protein
MIFFRLTTALLLASAVPAFAADFGMERDQRLFEQSQTLFGVEKPLTASADKSAEEGFRASAKTPADILLVAGGLKAEFVTRDVAHHADMISFYPRENPTHMIICIEADREEIESNKFNPGVQRVSMLDGKVETIVRGTSGCDGIRTTPWNTVLFTEEEDDGGAYEILNPLTMTEVNIIDRKKGEISNPAAVVKHMNLPMMAWEGLTILPSGVVFAGDELRPGTTYPDKDGGAIFKFVPTIAFNGTALTSLDASPFADGKTYAMQVSCTDKVQVGQGCDVGAASWVEVKTSNARITADIAGATGYYRPEDLHQDLTFKGEGVKFCWTNTGNKAIGNYGEVMCAVDALADTVEKNKQQVVVSRFLQGNADLNQPDNLEINPKNGLVYVIEDNPNGDVWSCLPDGADADMMTDGCVKILSVKDSSAEPTGFVFAPDGKTAYLNIQHSDDKNVPKVDGFGTDDLIKITGFGKVDLALK